MGRLITKLLIGLDVLDDKFGPAVDSQYERCPLLADTLKELQAISFE